MSSYATYCQDQATDLLSTQKERAASCVTRARRWSHRVGVFPTSTYDRTRAPASRSSIKNSRRTGLSRKPIERV
jgi:hypothetical protein